VIPPEVTKFLFRGADLMLGGVYEPRAGFASVKRGQKRIVKVRGNPSPVAVGITVCGVWCVVCGVWYVLITGRLTTDVQWRNSSEEGKEWKGLENGPLLR